MSTFYTVKYFRLLKAVGMTLCDHESSSLQFNNTIDKVIQTVCKQHQWSRRTV